MIIRPEAELTPLAKGTLASIDARGKVAAPRAKKPALDVNGKACVHTDEGGTVCGKAVLRGKGTRSGWLCWDHDRLLFPIPDVAAPVEKVRAA